MTHLYRLYLLQQLSAKGCDVKSYFSSLRCLSFNAAVKSPEVCKTIMKMNLFKKFLFEVRIHLHVKKKLFAVSVFDGVHLHFFNLGVAK